MSQVQVRIHTEGWTGACDAVEELRGTRTHAPFADRNTAEGYMAIRRRYYVDRGWWVQYDGLDEVQLTLGRTQVTIRVVPLRK